MLPCCSANIIIRLSPFIWGASYYLPRHEIFSLVCAVSRATSSHAKKKRWSIIGTHTPQAIGGRSRSYRTNSHTILIGSDNHTRVLLLSHPTKQLTKKITMETPDWLQTKNAGNDEENPSQKDWISPTSDENSGSAMDNTAENSMTSGKAAESATTTDSSSFASRCGGIMTIGLSVLLLALFVYSTIVQKNDDDKLLWFLFYVISACIPALYLIYRSVGFCCVSLQVKAIYILAAGMAIWATVQIVLLALKVADTPKGVDGNEDNQELREEYSFELGGACLSLFSSLYHALLVKCSSSAKKEEE